MALVEKRIEAHQDAFVRWRNLLAYAYSDDVVRIVGDCQQWWDRNCLYLSPKAREAFNQAYFAAANHKSLLSSGATAEVLITNLAVIKRAGEAIVSGAQLPSLGERESQDVTNVEGIRVGDR